MDTQTSTSKTGKSKAGSSPMLLKSLHLQNFLSFGPNTAELKLSPLNILVGANGSGKSNLIEAISLLRSSPAGLADTLRQGGGAHEWIWNGAPKDTAHIEAVITYPEGQQPLRHIIEFEADKHGFHLRNERIECELSEPGTDMPYFFYDYQEGNPVVNLNGERRGLKRETVAADKSILAQRQDPDLYPEITYLSEQYSLIRTYREWSFGRNTIFRMPQRADLRNDRLEEDFSNLGLFLSRLRRRFNTKREMISYLRDLYQGVDDFDINVEGGSVQVLFIEERGAVPATRLSDGTLRYLCLLAILCDPDPAPLICIEEPELGLHPDIIPKIADLLVKASQRTQIIVTTHSDILVDVMTERPEAVIVCEKREGKTEMVRLSYEDLRVWLQKYRLGQLWTRGDIGGTRW